MKSLVRNCENCEHAIWCDTFTEPKCTVHNRRIYDPSGDALRCKKFKKDRRTEKPKCQCKACLNRGTDDE